MRFRFDQPVSSEGLFSVTKLGLFLASMASLAVQALEVVSNGGPRTAH